jgi:hypothetical protein
VKHRPLLNARPMRAIRRRRAPAKARAVAASVGVSPRNLDRMPAHNPTCTAGFTRSATAARLDRPLAARRPRDRGGHLRRCDLGERGGGAGMVATQRRSGPGVSVPRPAQPRPPGSSVPPLARARSPGRFGAATRATAASRLVVWAREPGAPVGSVAPPSGQPRASARAFCGVSRETWGRPRATSGAS